MENQSLAENVTAMQLKDGGPAFPSSEPESVFVEEFGRYEERLGPPRGGMSLLDYFAAHAPRKPQEWFSPVMPEQPVLVFDHDHPNEHRCNLEIQCYAVNMDEIVAWRTEREKQRRVQWPYAWAKSQLLAKATIVLLLLLIPSVCLAQVQTPTIVSVVGGENEGFILSVPNRGDSGRFFTVARAALVTAAAADLVTTQIQIQRGVGREGGLGAGLAPVTLGVLKGSLTGGLVVLLSRLHRDKPKVALLIAALATGVEVGVARRNMRMGGGR